MAPEGERQRAWREAVRAFRLIATAFEDPTPALFAQLAGPEEGLRGLARELPLVNFSPFGVLPDGVAYGRDAELYRPAAGSDQNTESARERGTAGAGSPRPPGGPRDLPGMPSPVSESAHQPPVFSFRRGGASGVETRRQPSQRDRETEERPASESAGGRFRGPEPEPGYGRREEPEAVEASPDPNASARSEATTDDRGVEPGRGGKRYVAREHSSVHPMALLGGLAEDALKAAEQPTPDVPVRRSSVPTPRSAPSEGRAVRSRESGSKIGRDHGTDERASGEFGSPWFEMSAQRPARSLPDTVERGDPDLLAPSPGSSPVPILQTAPDNSAVTLIDSLAERLLAPEARDGGVEGSVAVHAGEQAGEEATQYRSPSDLLGSTEAKPAGPSDPARLDQGPTATTSFERYTEAEDFASLVNDVLVRQARRHGVDLS